MNQLILINIFCFCSILECRLKKYFWLFQSPKVQNWLHNLEALIEQKVLKSKRSVRYSNNKKFKTKCLIDSCKMNSAVIDNDKKVSIKNCENEFFDSFQTPNIGFSCSSHMPPTTTTRRKRKHTTKQRNKKQNKIKKQKHIILFHRAGLFTNTSNFFLSNLKQFFFFFVEKININEV